MRSRLGRDALRMDKRVPADGPRAQQTADAALLAQIRDLNELNWAQRDEISRMQVAQEQQAVSWQIDCQLMVNFQLL